MPGTSPSVCLRDETRRGLAPRGKCQMSLISIPAAAQLFQAISPAQATCHRLAGGPRARLRGWQQGGGPLSQTCACPSAHPVGLGHQGPPHVPPGLGASSAHAPAHLPEEAPPCCCPAVTGGRPHVVWASASPPAKCRGPTRVAGGSIFPLQGVRCHTPSVAHPTQRHALPPTVPETWALPGLVFPHVSPKKKTRSLSSSIRETTVIWL